MTDPTTELAAKLLTYSQDVLLLAAALIIIWQVRRIVYYLKL